MAEEWTVRASFVSKTGGVVFGMNLPHGAPPIIVANTFRFRRDRKEIDEAGNEIVIYVEDSEVHLDAEGREI